MVKPGITGLAQVSGLRGDEGDMNIGMKKEFWQTLFMSETGVLAWIL